MGKNFSQFGNFWESQRIGLDQQLELFPETVSHSFSEEPFPKNPAFRPAPGLELNQNSSLKLFFGKLAKLSRTEFSQANSEVEPDWPGNHGQTSEKRRPDLSDLSESQRLRKFPDLLGKKAGLEIAQQTAQQAPNLATSETKKTQNRPAWGEGWEEIRKVGKCGPYRYHCWRDSQGRRKTKYLGKVSPHSKATAEANSAGDTSI